MILNFTAYLSNLQGVVLKKSLLPRFFLATFVFLGSFEKAETASFQNNAPRPQGGSSLKISKEKNIRQAQSTLSGRASMVQKISLWETYRKDASDASFEDIVRFVNQHPTWPTKLIKEKAEHALKDTTPFLDILNWFSKNPPCTAKGGYYYARALFAQKNLKKNQKGLLKPLVQKIWHSFDFSDPKMEKKFLNLFGKFLTDQDHLERLNRLVIEKKEIEIARMKKFLRASHHPYVDTRKALLKNLKMGELLFKKLPTSLKSLPGMIHDRIKHLVAEERYQEAQGLLKQNLKSLFLAKSLWKERHVFVRDALRDGWHGREIYEVLKNHGLEEGGEFSDAEFLLGFVALTSLEKPKLALSHFEKLYAGVGRPISKTRAAYWAGRSAEALGQKDLARQWYEKAAVHPTIFYGQEALIKLKKPFSVKLLTRYPVSPQKRKSFESQDLVQAVYFLKENKGGNYLPLFLDHMALQTKTPEERALVLELTEKIAPELSVPITRTLVQKGDIFLKAAYPLIRFDPSVFRSYFKSHHKTFALAIIRKESSFNPGLTSPKGAIGLMQITPDTALDIVRKNNLPVFSSALEKGLMDAKKNLILGCVYLDNLLEIYQGSLYLVAAAYNAGPGRVDKWIKAYGDPRTGDVDVVEWIERIPYGETRNYIHRVIEAMRVYESDLKSPLKTFKSRGKEAKKSLRR